MSDGGLLGAARPVFVGEYDADQGRVSAVGGAGDGAAPGPGQVPAGYPTARLLVKRDGRPVGLALVPVRDGLLDATELARQVAALPAPATDTTGATTHATTYGAAAPSLTVTIATHNRADHLRRALASVCVDPTAAEILIVDNAPADDTAAQVVAEFAARDDRVRYVVEPRQGLSKARNKALAAASSEILLFTDDDVEVDREWAARHARGYLDPSISCLTGPAYAARLETLEEVLCEASIGWSKGFEPTRYELHRPPAGAPLFPFSPGLFGGGMNFSVRRALAVSLGGFDEALGAGSPTKGAEDCDFFVRLVRGGYVLGYEPAAYVRHHHRSDARAYADQRDGYAIGLGAYLAKLGGHPGNWAAIARRVPAVVAHHRAAQRPLSGDIPPLPRFQAERLMAAGAYRYASARLADAAQRVAGRAQRGAR